MDVEADRYETDVVAVEVRTRDGMKSYVIEVGRFAYVLLNEEEWTDLRGILQAIWEDIDGTNGVG